ncbi:MAG: hypothetical protein IJ668_06270 [Selenomonadaceae bacterium]|nr:hypothetical protein [Selenomonadaceae bacterium]
MNRPFTIARAIVDDFKSKHFEIVEGELDSPYDAISPNNGRWVSIKPDTLSFNTCLTDLNGKEIFTGDTLRKYNEPYTTVEVVYLPPEGAFYIKREETGVHYSNRYPDPTETRIDRADIIFQRLTQRVADCYVIVAHKQDSEVPPIDEHDELFDPPPPTVEGSDA